MRIHSRVRLSMGERCSCAYLPLSVRALGGNAWISQLLARTKTQRESDGVWLAQLPAEHASAAIASRRSHG